MKRLLQNDFFLALVFLVAYLLTNSYIFAWDDQHLEIPMLKHLIDPSLYKGDYYVETLAKNFSSYLFPILARFISVDQIQPVYFVLFLVARYFMFFWLFRLWQFLSGGSRWVGAAAVLMFFLMGRTEEFLYRTFSHQEFSYIFMFAGFYYFYRERFILAASLFGVGANFHAIYNLFPMMYMGAFLLFFRQDRWSMLLKTGATFLAFALPFLLWQIPRSLAREAGGHVLPADWMPLYLISCQQNFLFWTVPLNEALQHIPFMLVRLEPYLFLLVLYAFLYAVEPRLRQDKKTLAVLITAYALIAASVFFSYIVPSKFVLDLNLLRNEQFVRLMLMGYVTIWACHWAKEGRFWQVVTAGVLFFLIGFGGTAFLMLKIQKYIWVFAAFVVLAIAMWLRPQWPQLRYAFIILPLAATFISFTTYHVQYLDAKAHGTGLWQVHRNWVDMQKYVKAHTPKDALVMTPYDTETGGFRIFSERKVLVCYRDCGLIGFDYKAAVEWNRRIKDIEGFKAYQPGNIEQALITAITKYKVDYIVFMNYYQPQGPNAVLEKMYQNEVFALYHVKKLPL